jgi:hypothetical protein
VLYFIGIDLQCTVDVWALMLFSPEVRQYASHVLHCRSLSAAQEYDKVRK